MNVRGKVVFEELEGGLWGIVSPEGRRFSTPDLPAEFREPGLEVIAELERVPGLSIRMWGIETRVISVQRDEP